jgi:adenine-specific DNA-methyltransferase
MHRVRALLDEVFGDKQFISQITFTKTRPLVASTNLTTTADYILWYAKDAQKMKSRKVVKLRVDESLASHKQAASGEIYNSSSSMHGRAFKSDDLVRKNNPPFEFEFQGRKYTIGFRTNLEGMIRAAKADRLMTSGKSVRYKFYLDDYPVSSLSNVWADLIGAQDPVYVVQTNEEVIQRCMMMSTEPGDLVIDPTCGSGTTAFVAEQWGRRWITIDSSRVAVAIARQRFLTSTFEVYRSKDPAAGFDPTAPINPSFGFEYKKVPHITLKSIARNTGLDPIFARHDPILEQRLDEVNKALKDVTDSMRQSLVLKFSAKFQRDGARAITAGDLRKWLLPRTHSSQINFGTPSQRKQWISAIPATAQWHDWEVPYEIDSDWPQSLQIAVTAYRAAWSQKMSDVNAEISRNVDQEELVDQPEVIRNSARVSGTFTVEGVRPEELAIGEDGKVFDPTVNDDPDSVIANNQVYIDRMMQLMRMDGITFIGNHHVKLAGLESSMLEGIHAIAAYEIGENKATYDVGIVFGPQYGPVSVVQVGNAVESAKNNGIRELVIAGFSFDSAAQQLAYDSSTKTLRVNLSHIRPDVSPGMQGLLKDRKNSQLFTVFGQPEFKVVKADTSEYIVELGGVCVYNPLTGQVESSNASKVAAWFLDTDYDGNCFCPSQAFFPDSKAWDKIARALGSKSNDAEALQAFAGSISLSFKLGQHRRVAVKVIDPRGNEVMGIKTIS